MSTVVGVTPGGSAPPPPVVVPPDVLPLPVVDPLGPVAVEPPATDPPLEGPPPSLPPPSDPAEPPPEPPRGTEVWVKQVQETSNRPGRTAAIPSCWFGPK